MKTKDLKLSTQLQRWANGWYEYSFNDPEAERSCEMVELKRIIQELRRRRL